MVDDTDFLKKKLEIYENALELISVPNFYAKIGRKSKSIREYAKDVLLDVQLMEKSK